MLLTTSTLALGGQTLKTTSGVDVPTWSVGDSWVYDITVKARYYDELDITINLKNIIFEVEQVTDSEYHVSLSGSINAQGTYGVVSGGMSGGTISSGIVSIRKSDLAILGTEDLKASGNANIMGVPLPIEVSGFASLSDLSPINYIRFPLNVGDTWTRNPVTGLLTLKVHVGSLVNEDLTFNIYEVPDNLECVGTESISVGGKSFECYKIVGDMGDSMILWYSPDIGNIVKAEMKNFDLFFEEGNDLHYDIDSIDVVLKEYGKVSEPPATPQAPSGPSTGELGETYTFEASSTDPDGDKVKYVFDWGDETQTETNFVNSGQTASASHAWKSGAKFEIRVKAVDINGAESDWSSPSYIDIQGERGTVNLSVYIYRIKQLDEIDPWTSAEWSYRLSVWDGNGWVTRQYDAKSGDDIKPKKTYKFPVQTGEPKIKIKLWERDPVVKNPLTGKNIIGHDLADVSAYIGNGVNNKIPDDLRGAIYHGIYQLGKHKMMTSITEENDYIEKSDGYTITSGRFDGSEADDIDSNDAKIWFKVTDDYKPLSNVRITKPGDGSDFYTGQKIKFEAKVENGMAPFKWSWDFGDGTTSNKQNPVKVYDGKNSDYFVKVKVTDEAGTTLESKPIRVRIYENGPPDTPSKPYGPKTTKVGKECEYQTYAKDYQNDRVAYGWDWDGDFVVDEWDDNNGQYYNSNDVITTKHTWSTSGTKKVRVKAKDECGYESDWSDELVVVVSKSRTISVKAILQQLFERYIQILNILQGIVGL